ncbi:UNVERIFIED_CONTAM: hypothetical protein Sradi_5575200 [Sesamum radiatum]|uniref:MATH domain-containing protein n=1 Tax=Sesamum radiatum TaxID=300843 RepID=A0AAW2KXE3_SESRA
MDPRNTASSKWDCFASYRLAIDNLLDSSKSVHRDSWHRFSSKKKSHGWCDFASLNSLLDPKLGFLHLSNDCILITADILILHESFSFSRDNYDLQANNVSMMGGGGVIGPVVGDVLSGKFTWKVHNFSLFKEMIKTQKIMSPVFPAGECNLRISVYQSVVNGVEYLSMCLESKDTEKNSLMSDRSCWCLFRMSVLNQKPGNGSNHVHRDSYGRFAADNKSGDNTSLGWNDYMKMSDFMGPEAGFLVEDTAVFSTSFHVIKELSSFSKGGTLIGARNSGNVRKSDGHIGKFTWRIENFTRLKDLLKKRKITGLCIKSRRFQIGNRDCRLIVYPRGQSQPPCHLSVFLEVTDSRNTNSDWSCFVSHRLAVVNQRMEEKSVTKESQNRYSKAAKDWGGAKTSIMQDITDQETDSRTACSQSDGIGKRSSFTWKVENFLSFKEIMETRKIFSKFFQAGGCELRIGVYESFDTICIYLESDQSVGSDPEKNFWVSDMLEADAGFLLRDTVVFVCEILDCCPWLSFQTWRLVGHLKRETTHGCGAIAGFPEIEDDPAKVKRLLLPTKISGSNDGKKIKKNDESSPSLMNLLMGVKVLQQAIIDLLLDIMVECCQPSEESSSDDCSDISSKPSPDGTGATSPLGSDGDNGLTDSTQLSVGERLDLGIGESINSSAVQSCDLNGIGIHAKTVPVQPICPPETSAAGSCENPSLRSKTKWPEQSEELLGLIVNSLRALDGAVPQGCPEPRRRPQSAQKIALVLDKAPKHLQPDLVALVPKLVEQSEHPLAASALMDRLQKTDAEPALRLPVFGALSQLECGSDVWERVLFQSLELLADSNDEPLAATVDFIFKAALHCQHLPEAILRNLFFKISTAMMILVIISHQQLAGFLYLVKVDLSLKGYIQGRSSSHGCSHFSDIYILIEMLSIPCLAVEAAQTFERAVARGAFVPQSVAVVLERRLAKQLDFSSQYVAEIQQPDLVMEGEAIEQLRAQRDDFTSVLGLAETLALSKDSRVKGFVKISYTMLFKCYADESRRLRMLKRLVDRATTSADASQKAVLSQRLTESEATNSRLKSEMRAEMDRFARERKELIEQVQEIESQLEWVRSERDDEITKLMAEKKVLQDRLYDAETQLSQLKSRKRDELKRVMKEKNALAERLKSAEAARKRFDEELKRFATENVTREELRQSLEDEVRRLTQTVGQTEGEKREKEEQVARCEAYIDGMESKLQACEQYIHHLEAQLQEEMSRHAPLYGAGLEALSMKELETISRIHEEGLRQITCHTTA